MFSVLLHPTWPLLWFVFHHVMELVNWLIGQAYPKCLIYCTVYRFMLLISEAGADFILPQSVDPCSLSMKYLSSTKSEESPLLLMDLHHVPNSMYEDMWNTVNFVMNMNKMDCSCHYTFFPKMEKLQIDTLSTHCSNKVQIAQKERRQSRKFNRVFTTIETPHQMYW